MKLDFTFDSELSQLTDDKSSKTMGLSRSMHMAPGVQSTISSPAADLNFKIASVKKVFTWISLLILLIRATFDPRPVHMWIVVDKVSLGFFCKVWHRCACRIHSERNMTHQCTLYIDRSFFYIMSLGLIFLQVCKFSRLRIFPPALHTPSFICHQHSVILPVDSVIK